MPMPQGWEWLDDLPDEWEAPPDLQIPTPYPEVNLAIRLLSCEFLDFGIRAAIGRFITEEALYDLWFVDHLESAGWDARRSALLREVPMEHTRTVYEAWKELDSINQLDAPNAVLLNRRREAITALGAALHVAVEGFVRTRRDNSPNG
ncbi:hypothetical protein KRMM14A1259_47260 [Krasilnikovia sp. MM14-A1259]